MNKYETLYKNIDWKSLLLSNYRNMNLSEEEVMVILMIDMCLQQGDKMITPEILSLKMTYDTLTLSKLLTQLMNKSLILFEEDSDHKLTTTLKGIKNLVIDDFLKSFEKETNKTEETKTIEQNIFTIFENEFGRPLTYVEIDTMRSWVEEGFSEQIIVLALKEALVAKVKNIRYIDKILLAWRQEEERKKEGYTTITDSWRKDIKQTNDKLNWDNNDDK